MTKEELQSLVNYDPETGVFTWIARTNRPQWNGKWAGKQAGKISTKGNGYRRVVISLNSKIYLAHRLAWLYQTGVLPDDAIDHVNRDATDNRWENLRLACGHNQRNKSLQRNNSSGVAGVSWSKAAQKWQARAWSTGNRYVHLGLFMSIDEAAAALSHFRSEQGYSASHGQIARIGLPSMDWINHYLGSGYEDGARGPELYDCYGLVREARHLYQGKRLLPSWGHVRNTEPKEFTRAYRNEAEHMEVCQPEPGAIAAVMRGHICIHVALVVDAGDRLKVLEINPTRGARCLPLSQWERDHNTVIYYRDRQ